MTALFVALGIMVLALLALLLWFVPHLLQQQAANVSHETKRLRDMLLDLLKEQEALTLRQSQLGTSLMQLRDQIEIVAQNGAHVAGDGTGPAIAFQQLESRLSDLQGQIQYWTDERQRVAAGHAAQDNESWAHLMSLLAVIQERVGELSRERSNALLGAQTHMLIENLEQEMSHLRNISEDISKLQWRLRQSLHEREAGYTALRSYSSDTAG
jgi:chromosome segregation ATPase